jgi:hypothetical protein
MEKPENQPSVGTREMKMAVDWRRSAKLTTTIREQQRYGP